MLFFSNIVLHFFAKLRRSSQAIQTEPNNSALDFVKGPPTRRTDAGKTQVMIPHVLSKTTQTGKIVNIVIVTVLVIRIAFEKGGT